MQNHDAWKCTPRAFLSGGGGLKRPENPERSAKTVGCPFLNLGIFPPPDCPVLIRTVSYGRGSPAQGYLAQKQPPPPLVTTEGLCLGPHGDPRGVGVSHERDTTLMSEIPGFGVYGLGFRIVGVGCRV